MEKTDISIRTDEARHIESHSYQIIAALLIAIVVLCSSTDSRALVGKTRNKFVQAIVEPGSGLITWYDLPGPLLDGSGYLSFQDHSYLSLMIGGKLYSNNDNNMVTSNYVNLTYGGVVSILPGPPGTQTDTVRCIWNEGTFDIVQDVYPVAFETCGQIVAAVSIVNHGTAVLYPASQYLLDIHVRTNDRAKELTRFGYSPKWQQYPALDRGIPPFFVTFEHDLPPAPPTYDLGANGTGYTDRTDLKLIRPSRMTIGDWTTFVTWPFGIPSVPNGPYGDNAILFEWSQDTITPGATKTISRFSYGTGEFEECYGNLLSLTFYPQRLVYDTAKKDYAQNPFTVETLLFNLSSISSASSVKATLTVDDSLQIVYPIPTDPSNKTETHSPDPNSIAPLDLVDIAWQVHARKLDTVDAIQKLNLSVDAAGVAPPYLVSCNMPVILSKKLAAGVPIVAHTIDSLAPVVVRAQSTLLDSVLLVSDMRSGDSGLKDIVWKITTNQSNFNVVVTPPLPLVGCYKSAVKVEIIQLDSTLGGCLDFAFLDCAGNNATKTICMKSHTKIAGVAETGASDAVAIYPNPCRDEVTLRLGYADQAMPSVHLFNEAGDEIMVGLLSRQEQGTIRLDLHALAAGTYLARIDGNGWSRNVRIAHVK